MPKPTMSNNKNVAIIGAGIGGVTSAIYLAQKGYQVTIFEKNGFAGGRCSQITRDGHRFDLGATIFLMPSVYRDVFTSLGLDLDECFEFQPLTTLYHLFFDDGTVLDFTADEKKMEAQLEALEPGSYGRMQKYIKEGYTFLELGLGKLLGRNFYRLFDFVTFGNVGLLIRLKTYLRHSTYARRFFKNEHLQMAFTFQNIYVGQSPFRAPAFFSMLPAAELVQGSVFPRGGMAAVSEKLLEIALSKGVEIVYDRPAARIIAGKRSVSGILFEDGSRVEADIVLANADLPYVYNHLLPDSLMARKLKRMSYSCSALTFHWAIDKVYPGLSQHNVFLCDAFRECLDTIFTDKTMSADPCFYVHSPIRNDQTAAPDGCDSLSVLIPVGHIDPKKNQDWEAIRIKARKAVIDRLKEAGYTDLEDHIKFEICHTPGSWENTFNVTRGATFGSLSHSIFQMGYFRPHNRHRKYKNLYFAGGSTHPGNGVPLVLLSAKLTTERILKEQL
jgi:phytoene desaturase